MRILLVASALPSHFFAMAPFGWAARTAGHEVYAATTPDLVPAVSGSGLPTVPVGRALDFTGGYRRQSRDAGGAGDPKALFGAVAEAMVGDLTRFARAWGPDLVVWEPTTFAAPVAALEVGAPAVRYLWGPDIVGRGSSGRDRLPESVRALFGAGSGSGEVPDWWTVDPCPPSVQLAGERWLSVQYVPYSSQSRVPVSLLPSPGRRRVLVTLGLSVTELVGESAFLPPLVLDALAGYGDLDVLVAVQPGQQELLGTLPGNARAVAGCPLHLLMPSCALVVHHGGAGSLLTAARYGVPQLMLTQMPDLGFYAGRLAATGAGVHLRGADADAHSVRAAVADLLGRPEYPAAAVRLRAEALAQPTPADLVHRLLLEGVRS